jgi:branched-chain amino acid transport system ATP-binding protein
MNPVIFKTDRLSVTFGGLSALDGLDVRVRRGEIVGLIGPNGAGKTTMFNVVTGFVKPSAGTVTFKGMNITGFPPHRTARLGIARTFQNIRLYGDLTVLENVMVAGHSRASYSIFEAMTGIGRRARVEKALKEKALHLLEMMGLEDLALDKADSLPYGSRRKLETARALALDPELLLLDEPVAGMNPSETVEFGDLLRKVKKTLDLSILLIEHDMGFVMDLCDKIRVLNYGAPIAWGTPAEIQVNERVIAAYLGRSQ